MIFTEKSWLIFKFFLFAALLSIGVIASFEILSVDLSSEILWNIRMPRILLCCIAGGCLGMAGVLSQHAFQNHLATPSILGIESFAALVGAGFLFFANSSIQIFTMPIATWLGTMILLSMILFLSRQQHHKFIIHPDRVLVLGFSMNALFGALTSLLVLLMAQSHPREANLFYWMFGDLNSRSWEHLILATCGLGLALPWVIKYSYQLNILWTGYENAFYFGVQPAQALGLNLIACGILVASSCAAIGSVPFLGFTAPLISRVFFGAGVRRNLIGSFLIGGILLLLADTLSRILWYRLDVPAGVLISLLSTPLLVWSVWKQKKFSISDSK